VLGLAERFEPRPFATAFPLHPAQVVAQHRHLGFDRLERALAPGEQSA
jgi:hypothetical protein